MSTCNVDRDSLYVRWDKADPLLKRVRMILFCLREVGLNTLAKEIGVSRTLLYRSLEEEVPSKRVRPAIVNLLGYDPWE